MKKDKAISKNKSPKKGVKRAPSTHSQLNTSMVDEEVQEDRTEELPSVVI